MHKNLTGAELQKAFELRRCSIVGLPIDMLTMQESVDHIYGAIDGRQPCFISTPNLNFLISSKKDRQFRASVINSDLSLADGMPILWIAKLLRIPLAERVAGSSLIETLMKSDIRLDKPVKIFFFGGMDGVADQACEQLGLSPCGLSCVGSLNPGFGSVAEMSTSAIIETINRSDAEFIIVSLGAKKGQAWIEHNRNDLDAPLISHLGAVVNFVAGTVLRAPELWQRSGLEWLWRIKEEPALWKRYFSDGLELAKLLITRVLPYALIIFRNRHASSQAAPVLIEVFQHRDETRVALNGALVAENLQPVRDAFASLCHSKGNICLDLSEASYIDPFFIGQLMILYRYIGDRLSIRAASGQIIKILSYNDVSFLCEKTGCNT